MVVFAQIAAQRKAQQTGQRCKGLDAVLHCPVHKALLGQPHPGAAHPALPCLHHIPLHRALGGCSFEPFARSQYTRTAPTRKMLNSDYFFATLLFFIVI